MIILPAIDLYGGCAVRLYKGDYDDMTVYSREPEEVARDFESCGAEYIHIVDLEGARDGGAPNLAVIERIARGCSCKLEVGGGVRSLDTIKKYLDAGASRVILGTAAVSDPEFLPAALESYGPSVAVSVDIRDGLVAVKGWRELSDYRWEDFFTKLVRLGVATAVCTDISRDGAMGGTNLELYRRLREGFKIDVIASGGVSSLEDVRALRAMGLYGAIIGRAYYEGAVELREAIEVAGC